MSDYTPSAEDFINLFAANTEGGYMDMSQRAKIARRGIAKLKADALREAESALRVMGQNSPYVEVSRGQCADGWGNDCGDIDHGYADWLRERADRIEKGL